jgi:hypothetical protein
MNAMTSDFHKIGLFPSLLPCLLGGQSVLADALPFGCYICVGSNIIIVCTYFTVEDTLPETIPGWQRSSVEKLIEPRPSRAPYSILYQRNHSPKPRANAIVLSSAIHLFAQSIHRARSNIALIRRSCDFEPDGKLKENAPSMCLHRHM